MPGTFAEALRASRERAGRSQVELSRRSGISVDTISAYERGVRRPGKPAAVRRLAAGLRAPAGPLLECAGFAATGRVLYEVDTTMRDLQREAETYPWPCLMNNENLEVAGGNAASARLAGLRFGQVAEPGSRHLLRMALDPRVRPKLTSLESMLRQLSGIFKSDSVDLAGPSRGPRFFQSVVHWIGSLDPDTRIWLFGVWASAPPWGIGRRMTFTATWAVEGGADLRFNCVIGPWSMLLGVWAFDWHPADGRTWDWLRAQGHVAVAPPPENAWSALIEERREAYGHTRPEVARMAKVSANSVYQWERGIRRPTAANFRSLVEGITMDGATAGLIADALGYEPTPAPAYRFLAGEDVPGRPELRSMELIPIDTRVVQDSIDEHHWATLVVAESGAIEAENAAMTHLLAKAGVSPAGTFWETVLSEPFVAACPTWDAVAPVLVDHTYGLAMGRHEPRPAWGVPPAVRQRYSRALERSASISSIRGYARAEFTVDRCLLRFNAIVSLWNIWDRYVAVDLHPADGATWEWVYAHRGEPR